MLTLTLPQIGRTPRLLLGGLVAALGLVLVLAGWRAVSGKRVPTAAVSSSPDALLEAIAELDARYAGREAETAAGEWAQYQTGSIAAQVRARVGSCGRRCGPIDLRLRYN